jgi:phosphonopyruvate decarboxylase
MTMKRDLCMAEIARHRKDAVICAVYGAAFDMLYHHPHPLIFVSFGAMGLLSSQALGMALCRPDKRFIVLDGDGSLLMNLGTLVTVAEVAPKNFVHFVCENGTYETNGGHPIPGRNQVNFAGMARAAGYKKTYEFSELEDFKVRIGDVLNEEGPVFATLKIEPGSPSPKNWAYIHGPASRNAFKAAMNAG